MQSLAEKVESIAAKISSGVMPTDDDSDVLADAAGVIRIFHKMISDHDNSIIKKLNNQKQQLSTSTLDQIIADEAMGEIVRLTRKISMLEMRLKGEP